VGSCVSAFSSGGSQAGLLLREALGVDCGILWGPRPRLVSRSKLFVTIGTSDWPAPYFETTLVS